MFPSIGFEQSRCGLFSSPRQKLLESLVGKNSFNRVIDIPKLIVSPRFVNIILACLARGNGFFPTLGSRNNMVFPSWCRHFAKYTRHSIAPVAAWGRLGGL